MTLRTMKRAAASFQDVTRGLGAFKLPRSKLAGGGHVSHIVEASCNQLEIRYKARSWGRHNASVIDGKRRPWSLRMLR